MAKWFLLALITLASVSVISLLAWLAGCPWWIPAGGSILIVVLVSGLGVISERRLWRWTWRWALLMIGRLRWAIGRANRWYEGATLLRLLVVAVALAIAVSLLYAFNEDWKKVGRDMTWLTDDPTILTIFLLAVPVGQAIRTMLTIIQHRDQSSEIALLEKLGEDHQEATHDALKFVRNVSEFHAKSGELLQEHEISDAAISVLADHIAVVFADIAKVNKMKDIKVTVVNVEKRPTPHPEKPEMQVKEVVCVKPQTARGEAPLDVLRDPRSTFSRSLKKAGLIVLTDVDLELAKGNAGWYLANPKDPASDRGSLLVFPFEREKNVEYLIAVHVDRAFCFWRKDSKFYRGHFLDFEALWRLMVE